jgi:ribosomal protein L37AE/L43A
MNLQQFSDELRKNPEFVIAELQLKLDEANKKIAELTEKKTFCPNCEKETDCTHTAELYECEECGEDFAKYITGRGETSKTNVSVTENVLMLIKTELLSKEPDFDNMPIEQVNQYLREHGYDPEQVGVRGKVLAEALMKNVEYRSRLAVCEDALISMVQQFFYSADGGSVFSHSFMSAEEEAAAYLVGVGIAGWNDEQHSTIVFPEVKNE